MNIKKTKIALTLGGFIFLAAPLASAFAHEQHAEINQMQMVSYMKTMKDELRGYVKGFKADDSMMMQQQLNKLLKLNMFPMDHSKISNEEMMNMDHSKMSNEEMMNMDHSKMSNVEMMNMDHSKISNVDMMNMDHSKISNEEMMNMDHSKMSNEEMMNMDHSKMSNVDMKTMHLDNQNIYTQGISRLQALFELLDNAQDKSEIKIILGKIKEQIKMID